MVLFFFFKQKTAYEMRISDWSSDVCSSDLRAIDRRYESQRRSKVATTDYIGFIEKIIGEERRIDSEIADVEDTSADIDGRDRKSVVEGKSVSVRVDLGGRRIIKKKTTHRHRTPKSTMITIRVLYKTNK